jgi:hypothetical protein
MSAVVVLVEESLPAGQLRRSVLMEGLIPQVVLQISTKFTCGSKLLGPDDIFERFIFLSNRSPLMDRAMLVVDADAVGSDGDGT